MFQNQAQQLNKQVFEKKQQVQQQQQPLQFPLLEHCFKQQQHESFHSLLEDLIHEDEAHSSSSLVQYFSSSSNNNNNSNNNSSNNNNNNHHQNHSTTPDNFFMEDMTPCEPVADEEVSPTIVEALQNNIVSSILAPSTLVTQVQPQQQQHNPLLGLSQEQLVQLQYNLMLLHGIVPASSSNNQQ